MSDLWLIEYEAACERYAASDDEESFRAELAALGFNQREIEEEIHAATA